MASNSGQHTTANAFHRIDYLKITVFGFGLSALWSSLHIIILPLRLLDFVPPELKNTYLDLLILAGLVLALAVQPIAGAISDRSSFSWGRRRPYILLGTLLAILFLPGVGFFASYAAVFVIYCLLQVSTNVAQGPYQGFIPDLVPDARRGVASGVRSLLNILGGLALLRLIGPLMDRYFQGEGSSWLWLALGAPAIVLLGAMLITVLTVKERPGTPTAQLRLLSTLRRSYKVDVKARPDFVLFLVACFFIFLAWATVQGHILYYLMDVVGIARPGEVTGNLLVVIGICLLVAAYPAGRLSDRIGRKPIVVSSALFGALGVVALFFSQSYTQVMLSGGLLGLSGGAWMSSQWALATDLVSKGEEARYLGLANMSSAAAGALSRLIGPLIDFLNTYGANLGYQVMLLVCFVSFIVGAALLLRIKAPRLAGLAHHGLPTQAGQHDDADI